MELGTFGAIVSYAIELEEQAAVFYEGVTGGSLAETFAELAKGSRKRLDRLQRARQELIAEMILEPITGLNALDYGVALDSAADEAGLRSQARALEETSARFYRDAAAKMPIKEVVRLFERLLGENEKRLAKLG
jgi:rubrerythrin